jgi:hypothetical protein
MGQLGKHWVEVIGGGERGAVDWLKFFEFQCLQELMEKIYCESNVRKEFTESPLL